MELLKEISSGTTTLYPHEETKLDKIQNKDDFLKPKIFITITSGICEGVESYFEFLEQALIFSFNYQRNIDDNGNTEDEDFISLEKGMMQSLLLNPNLKQLKINDNKFPFLNKSQKNGLLLDLYLISSLENLSPNPGDFNQFWINC
jgi:hypothetical protein